MSRHRAYCFTINNYTSSDRFAVEMLMKKAKYGICGDEIGEDKKTPHLQCYIHLENDLSFTAIKKFIPRANIRAANGSDLQNFQYCSKDGKYKEWGEKSEGQGKRNDIKEIADLIRSHQITIEDIMFDYPDMYLKYSRSFEKMFNAVQPHRETKPEVYWRWGLAGTGKTKWVIQKHGPSHVYIKDGSNWWDGYHQQDVILIDDFAPPTRDNGDFRQFLRLLDRNRFQGQVKGGFVNINSPYIFITCEFPPEHFWADNMLAQVLRRITSVEEIK